MWMIVVLAAAAPYSSEASPPAKGCRSDTDCSLNGVCQGRRCVCDPGWSGDRCERLVLEGHGRLAYGDPDGQSTNITAWGGGPPVFDPAQRNWVLFVTEIGLHCGLSEWGHQSTVVSATADSPAGPFQRRAGVAIPMQAHNPYYAYDPSSRLHVLFHIGDGRGPTSPPVHCRNGTTPNVSWLAKQAAFTGCPCACGPCGSWVHVSASLGGPFKRVNVSMPEGFVLDNPAPYIFPNGTVLVLSRRINWCAASHTCNKPTSLTDIWLFRAASFRGPYELVHSAPITGTAFVEDPCIWRDRRGHFHALFHGPGHAFSRDGLHWEYDTSGSGPSSGPFNASLQHDNGTVQYLLDAERPRVWVNQTSGLPELLFLASGGANQPTHQNIRGFNVRQRIRTSVVAVADSDRSACATDSDCELLGECVEGKCVCDLGWTGATCSTLKQGDSSLVWPRDEESYSWGASLIRTDGEVHMFNDVGCLKDTCAHTVGASIVHSVSHNGILGPYELRETAIPGEVENIHAVMSPNGTALLFYGDHEFVWPNKSCTGGGSRTQCGNASCLSSERCCSSCPPYCNPPRDFCIPRTQPCPMDEQPPKLHVGNNPYPRSVKRMGIAYRQGLSGLGGWKHHFPEYDKSMEPYLPVVNPSPLVLPNGTVLLAFRYNPAKMVGETNALAVADSWEGPYRLVTANATPGDDPGHSGGGMLDCEDPFLFLNKRGLHMVFHCYRGLKTGCHSYSADGRNWTVSPHPVYDTTIHWDNGTTHQYMYRERPELVFNKAGVPLFLLTGVEWGDKSHGFGGCGSYSAATAILA